MRDLALLTIGGTEHNEAETLVVRVPGNGPYNEYASSSGCAITTASDLLIRRLPVA